VLRTYTRDLDAYVIPGLGSIRVSQLRRREVRELLVENSSQGTFWQPDPWRTQRASCGAPASLAG
jgi:hypothetical protein